MSDHEPSASHAGPPLAGAPRTTLSRRRRSLLLLACLAALLLVGAVALWRTCQTPSGVSATSAPVIKTGIATAAVDSHRALPTLTADGRERERPADPSLEQALSLTSGLPLSSRLETIHKLQGATLTAAQVDFMRAFVADPHRPEGLTIQEVRALKNDVLNVVCEQPGQEAATAAVLRALYADKTQDAGLRDYALQHLVTLIGRDPALGWETHWAAAEGDNPDLAATAMLHLLTLARPSAAPASTSDPEPSAFDRARLARAALRLAANPAAKAPARATALQVCGQLKVAAARELARDIARSDKASIPFRIAAVATLGDLGGDTATRDYLVALTTGPEKRLRVPARSALKRFSIINN